MQTIYDFELPKGYVDRNGNVHKKGKMRLATAGDEIGATKDPRVMNNPSFLTVVVLARVIVELEDVEMVTTTLIEQLFTADLAFLQNMYEKINNVDAPAMKIICPQCGFEHEVAVNFIQEG